MNPRQRDAQQFIKVVGAIFAMVFVLSAVWIIRRMSKEDLLLFLLLTR